MIGYRPDIDGLRAFSIIAVVIYHAFPALMPLSLIHISEPTRPAPLSRMPSSA